MSDASETLTEEQKKWYLRGFSEGAKYGKQEHNEAEKICGHARPPRDVLCQLPKHHKERHKAVIFWEED